MWRGGYYSRPAVSLSLHNSVHLSEVFHSAAPAPRTFPRHSFLIPSVGRYGPGTLPPPLLLLPHAKRTHTCELVVCLQGNETSACQVPPFFCGHLVSLIMQHLSSALTFTGVCHYKAADSCRRPSPWRRCHKDLRAAGGIIFTEYALTFSQPGSRSLDNAPCYHALSRGCSRPFRAVMTMF